MDTKTTIESIIFQRLFLSSYGITRVSKNEIIDLHSPLPTIKKSRLIIRQKQHPFGDWEIFKPTKKHQYFVRAISPTI